MKRCFALVVGVLLTCGGVLHAADAPLRIATFDADITCPPGTPLCDGLCPPAKEIVDPLTALAPEVENKNSDATKFYQELRRGMRLYGCSYLGLHHRKKPTDSLGQQSASLLVVEKDAGYANLSDVVVDLRVDDHELPIVELRRLYALHNKLFGVTPPEDWIAVDETLAAELRDRLAELGYEGALDKAFSDWAGTENLEERVEGVDRIDPVVLAALRDKSR